MLLVLATLFAFQIIAIPVAASPIIFEAGHHIGVLEIYTHDEIENSVWEGSCTNGLSRVLLQSEVCLECESMLVAVSVAQAGARVSRVPQITAAQSVIPGWVYPLLVFSPTTIAMNLELERHQKIGFIKPIHSKEEFIKP